MSGNDCIDTASINNNNLIITANPLVVGMSSSLERDRLGQWGCGDVVSASTTSGLDRLRDPGLNKVRYYLRIFTLSRIVIIESSDLRYFFIIINITLDFLRLKEDVRTKFFL